MTSCGPGRTNRSTSYSPPPARTSIYSRPPGLLNRSTPWGSTWVATHGGRRHSTNRNPAGHRSSAFPRSVGAGSFVSWPARRRRTRCCSPVTVSVRPSTRQGGSVSVPGLRTTSHCWPSQDRNPSTPRTRRSPWLTDWSSRAPSTGPHYPVVECWKYVEAWRRGFTSYLKGGQVGPYFRAASGVRRRWLEARARSRRGGVVSVGHDGTALWLRVTRG